MFSLTAGKTEAQFSTTDKIYQDCVKGGQAGNDTLIPLWKCMGYLKVVVDAEISVFRDWYCIPETFNSGMLKGYSQNWANSSVTNPIKLYCLILRGKKLGPRRIYNEVNIE